MDKVVPGVGFGTCVVNGAFAHFAGSKRQAIRLKYGIQSNECCACCSCCFNGDRELTADACTWFWCGPCALCQEAREVKFLAATGQLDQVQGTAVFVAPEAIVAEAVYAPPKPI